MRIAFITAAAWRDLYDDDRLAADELKRDGVDVVPAVWTETSVEALDAFDAVVMRSPWDWYRRRAEFRQFLSLLRRVEKPVFNAPEVLAQFADKTYLPRLAAERGVRVVPTEVLEPGVLSRVPAVLESRAWARAVLKPAFTANAWNAHRFEAADAARVVEEAAAASVDGPWLLQPYVEEIAGGEHSFVFFDGVFSHAVKKLPKPGDWRVQHEYGGRAEPFTPTALEIAEAADILHRCAPDTLYARVDGVVHAGHLHLMELEAVEPELFFRLDAGSPRRFAEALVDRLRGA